MSITVNIPSNITITISGLSLPLKIMAVCNNRIDVTLKVHAIIVILDN